MSDLNYIEGVEKAIQRKYGKKAVTDPRSSWSDEKEKEFSKQVQERREAKTSKNKEKADAGGFLVRKKLLNTGADRNCPVCLTYSFSIKDDVYVNKFSCCYKCFVRHVEGREARWMNGWRPNTDDSSGQAREHNKES